MYATTEYLEQFLRKLILEEPIELQNRTMLIGEEILCAPQSAIETGKEVSKCKICTLDCTLDYLSSKYIFPPCFFIVSMNSLRLVPA